MKTALTFACLCLVAVVGMMADAAVEGAYKVYRGLRGNV